MTNVQRTIAMALGSALIVSPASTCRAQGETDSMREVPHTGEEAKLAAALWPTAVAAAAREKQAAEAESKKTEKAKQ